MTPSAVKLGVLAVTALPACQSFVPAPVALRQASLSTASQVNSVSAVRKSVTGGHARGMTMQQRGGQNQKQNKNQGPLSPLAQPNVNAIGSYVVGEFILGGIAVLAARWVGINPSYWADAVKNPQTAQLVTAAIAALPLVLAQPLTDRLPWFQGITRDTKLYTLALLGYKKDIPKALGIGILLSVAAAVGEELFFRGVLQTGFAGAYGPTWGLVISSFLFGVFHTPFPAANAFVESLFGVAVGVLYASSGYNIAVPIVTHAVYDVFTILRQHVEVTDTVANVSGRLKAATQNQPADSPQVAKKIDELKKSKNLPEDFVRLGRTIFAFLDLDNSGSIDKKELVKGLGTLNGKKPSDKEADDLIKAVDTDKDGQIDFAEFLQSAVNAIPQIPNPQRK